MHKQFLPSQHLMLRKHAPLTRLDTDRIIHSTVIFLRHGQVSYPSPCIRLRQGQLSYGILSDSTHYLELWMSPVE